MNEKLKNYLRIQINLGRLTFEEVKAKYPKFMMEEN